MLLKVVISLVINRLHFSCLEKIGKKVGWLFSSDLPRLQLSGFNL